MGRKKSVSFGYGRYRARTQDGYYEGSLGVTNANLTRGDPELALPVAAADLIAFLTQVQNDPLLYPQYGFPLFQYSEDSTIVSGAGEIFDRTL